MKAIKTTFFCLLFSTPGVMLAQKQFSGWTAAFCHFKVSGPFSIHLDVQARSTDELEHFATFIFRPGINMQVRKNMTATAGYGYIAGRRSVGTVSGYLPEHRVWEQLLINQPVAFTSIAHRFRLEQRFISKATVSNGKLKADGNVFANRLRYFTRSVLPLSGKKGFEKGFFGAVQNEVFLNLGDKSSVNGKIFDQNRLYLAAGYRICKKMDLEAGYLNQYISGRNSAFTNNHALQLAIYVRM